MKKIDKELKAPDFRTIQRDLKMLTLNLNLKKQQEIAQDTSGYSLQSEENIKEMSARWLRLQELIDVDKRALKKISGEAVEQIREFLVFQDLLYIFLVSDLIFFPQKRVSYDSVNHS